MTSGYISLKAWPEQRSRASGRTMPRRRRGLDLLELVTRIFERAEAQFPDAQAVNRILLEASRFYDPLTGGLLLPHALRRQIVELIQQGKTEEASRLLKERLESYAHSVGEADRPAAVPPRES